MGKKIASCQTLHFSGEDQRWEQAILFLRRYYYLTSGGSQSYMYATQKMSLALGGMQRWRKGSASCSYGLSSFHQPLLLLLVQMRLQDLPAVWVVRVHPVDLNRGQKLGVYQLGLVWSLHITQPKKRDKAFVNSQTNKWCTALYFSQTDEWGVSLWTHKCHVPRAH
jgi:hypothetical protein